MKLLTFSCLIGALNQTTKVARLGTDILLDTWLFIRLPPASPCSYGGPLVLHYFYGSGLILRRKRYFMMYSSYIYPDRVSASCTNSPRSEIFHRSQANSQLRQNGVWKSRSWNGAVYPGREGESQISESCSLFNWWMLGKVCGKGWIEARFQDRDLPC